MPSDSATERSVPTLAAHLESSAGVAAHEGLDTVIAAIASGAVEVERLTRLAALADVLGSTGDVNVQGEVVQRLDAAGTEIFVKALRDCGRVGALACEELEEMVHVSDDADHPYLAVFDPVDGSSNIDVGVTIGSIFGIYKRAGGGAIDATTLLRPGREQVAAVYAIYGSSTVLVVATAGRVDGFTLDPGSGRFALTHPEIRVPGQCRYYSVNEHYFDRWSAGVQTAVADLRAKYGLRYVGSLVADFHRNLLKGGVFFYPGERKSPAGKLRLGCEANPLSYVAEQAGGAGSNGSTRILDLTPEELHQRTPLLLGNEDAVREVEAAIATEGASEGGA